MCKICSFFGHREIKNGDKLRLRLEDIVKRLIEDGYTTFLFGGLGEFDAWGYQVVSSFKERFPDIKRVFCLTDERHLRIDKRPKWLKQEDYEEFTYLTLEYNGWYKRIYYRNCAMIDESDFVIFYTEERADSGAYKALRYAKKKKREYVNLIE